MLVKNVPLEGSEALWSVGRARQRQVIDVIHVGLEFLSDCLAGGLIRAGDDAQEVSLEAGQLEGFCMDHSSMQYIVQIDSLFGDIETVVDMRFELLELLYVMVDDLACQPVSSGLFIGPW